MIAWTFNPSPERAEALGVRFVELEELLARSDYVSLHVALTDDTRHLIGAPELAAMKPEAVLLNGARGEVVDLQALAAALDAGGPRRRRPRCLPRRALPGRPPDQALRAGGDDPPHMADQTPEGVELLNVGAVDNIIAWLEGEPRNNVAS